MKYTKLIEIIAPCGPDCNKCIINKLYIRIDSVIIS